MRDKENRRNLVYFLHNRLHHFQVFNGLHINTLFTRVSCGKDYLEDIIDIDSSSPSFFVPNRHVMTISMKKNLLGRPRPPAEFSSPVASIEIPVSPFSLDERSSGDGLSPSGKPRTPTFKLRRSHLNPTAATSMINPATGSTSAAAGVHSSDGLLESISSFSLSTHSSGTNNNNTSNDNTKSNGGGGSSILSSSSSSSSSLFSSHRSTRSVTAHPTQVLPLHQIVIHNQSEGGRGRSFSMFESLSSKSVISPRRVLRKQYDGYDHDDQGEDKKGDNNNNNNNNDNKKKEEEEVTVRQIQTEVVPSSSATTAAATAAAVAATTKTITSTENQAGEESSHGVFFPRRNRLRAEVEINLEDDNEKPGERDDDDDDENERAERVRSPSEGCGGRRRTFSVHDVMLHSM